MDSAHYAFRYWPVQLTMAQNIGMYMSRVHFTPGCSHQPTYVHDHLQDGITKVRVTGCPDLGSLARHYAYINEHNTRVAMFAV